MCEISSGLRASRFRVEFQEDGSQRDYRSLESVCACIMCEFKMPRYDKLEKFPRTRLLIINHWSRRDG